MNRNESPATVSTRTFTPTERQSELEALRQRGLTKQLNRHFNEQVAKVALQKDPMIKRLTTTMMTTTTKVSANREISPLDAIYLSITKWRRESRQRETMHPRHSVSPDTTVRFSTRVELPELEIPVSDAAQQIEINLQEYVQTGASPLPSVESLGNDVTYAHEKCLPNSIVAQQVDARCTPTAEQVAVYVKPGAFVDCISAEGFDTDGENEETSTSTSSFTYEDEASKLAMPSRGDDHDMTKQVQTKIVSKPCALRDEHKCDVWDAPPALVASPRSTDETWKPQTKPLFAHNNGFMCGVAVIVAVGMYYSLGLQHHL
ncbi:hypothetical protein FisN_24Lh171 [Fistulifera solaris]|uniref:Uncharacterized protein n=1 Tax=Fistulifera solaris TaxID=1519565 RepID=A0A1Z5K9H4_FISSO|nr:hypothetical protein FisN_24Lh171 [Fistulifera solaris]|eukprot:GAX22884.1 hypothetical protein FisN_24Lh171 [Fistulifera solaris]